MGDLAARTLLRRIREGNTEPEEILVQPELVVRDSTCAPRKGQATIEKVKKQSR
jgi:DNA-binding LacI/PurR family transcriptional regulator